MRNFKLVLWGEQRKNDGDGFGSFVTAVNR